MTHPDTNTNVVLTADVNQYQQSMGQANDSTNTLINSLTKLNQATDHLFRSAGRKLELFGAGEMAGVGTAVRSLAALDQQMSQIRANAALTGGSGGVGKIRDGIRDLGTQIPMTQRELVALATTIQSLGVRGSDQIISLTKTFAQLQAVTGESGAGLATGLIQLTRSMGNSLNSNDVKGYAAAVADLSAKLGTSATGLTQFAQAIQPMGKIFGLTEKQILGMSGAFSKAGADSTAAANAFGQMITLITNDLQTGSPQIKQFADIIGTSTDGFTKMAKANPAETITELFEALQKGGKSSLQVYQSLGLDGIRTMNAFQRVSQGGGIRGALGISANAKPGDLAKGSQAAFSDLNDEIAKLGHTLKELATGPFQALTKGLTVAVGFIEDLVAAFAKLEHLPGVHMLTQALGLIAGFAGPLLALSGILVAMIPVLAKLGFAWTAIFSRSGLSVMGGMRDRLAGVEQSAAAAATQRGMAGAGAAQSMFYRSGQYLGGGALRLGLGRPGTGPGLPVQAAAGAIRLGTGAVNQLYGQPVRAASSGLWGFARGGTRGALMSRYEGSPFSRTLGQQFQRSREDISGRLSTVTSGRVGTAALTPDQKVTAAAAAEAKALEQLRLATLAAAKSSNAQAEADRVQAKAGAKAATANLEQAKATAAAASAAVRADEGLNTVGAASANAAKSLLGLAGASAKAGAGMLAAGVGTAARGIGSMATSAVGGPLGAAFIGYMGYSYLSSRNKKMSEDQLESTSGTLVGNLNELAKSTGGTTTSMDALTSAAKGAADNLNKTANAGTGGKAPGAWSQAEITQVTASGYDPKTYRTGGRITQEQQRGQVLGAGIGLYQTSPTKAGIDQVRKDLLASYGGDKDQTKKVWNELVEATGNFKHASTDVALNTRVARAAYSEQVTATQGRMNPFGGASSAQQRATSNLEGIAKVLGVSPTGGGAAQNTLALLAALPAGHAASTAPGAAAPPRVSSGTEKAYEEAAKAMGFPASYGKVNSLRDLIVNILSSKDKGVQAQAERLNLPQNVDVGRLQNMGSVQAQQYLARQGITAGAAANTAQARAGAQQSLYQQYNLGSVGVAKGPAANAITSVLGGGAQDGNLSANAAAVAKAADALAGAVTKGGASAAEATGKLSHYAATTKDTTGAVQALTNAAQALVDQFNQMQRSTMAPGQALASINAEMASLDKNDKDYGTKRAGLQQQQQSVEQSVVSQAQSYLLARHQLNIQLERGQQDYQLQVSRANQQFDLQQQRAEADFDKQRLRQQKAFQLQESRAQADFNLQRAQSQADYNKSRSRANRDFLYQESQYVKQMADSLDPWSQVQAQSTTDAGQLLANLQQQGTMFQNAKSQLDKLKEMGISQNVVDTLGLSDPKNMQQLDRFYKDVAANPKLIDTFNKSIKGRLTWTKGLSTDEASTEWREMKHQFDQAAGDAETDFDTAMDRSEKAFKTTMKRAHTDYKTATDQNADDFQTATERSVTDFNTQMSNMQKDYKTSIKRSLQDVNDFATEAYGTANSIMKKAMQTADGNMKKFFDDASAQFTSLGSTISDAASNVGGAGGAGGGAVGAGNPFTGNKGIVYAHLAAAGLSGTSIAGIMGNIQQESGFNPTATDGTAHGIAQWQGARLPALKAYAAAHGKPWTDVGIQTDFLVHELKSRGTSVAGLNAMKTPTLAAQEFETKFEGASIPAMDNRTTAANQFYTAIKKQNTSESGLRETIIATAKAQLGTPYKAVGDEKAGVSFDCSGLVQYVYKQFGIKEGHYTNTDYKTYGKHVPYKDAKPGDVVYLEFGEGGKGGPGHVGIFLGGTTVLESPSPGGKVSIRNYGNQLKKDWFVNLITPNDVKKFASGGGRYADGALLVNRPQSFTAGERGPEAIIPLNATGAQFLVDMANKLNMSALDSRVGKRYDTPVQQTISHTHVDSSTNFTGPVTVQAHDPNAMATALKNKARMVALTNPDLTSGALP